MAAPVAPQAGQRFADLLLVFRGRTHFTQRALAAQAGVSPRSVQVWEAGVNYPTAERLRSVIGALIEGGGLTEGRERDEAESMWAAALRESPRMHTPFDTAWFEDLLARATTPTAARPLVSSPVAGRLERREDWSEAPDTIGFVGRAGELALLRRWVLAERCRLVALLGVGGIGKTSLAARLARDVALNFERVCWRSARDAPPVSEGLSGAISFLSDQQVVPPAAESERVAALLQLLRERRCLLVLDNSEALFEPGQPEGVYRAGMEGYGRLFRAVGEASHESCLVLTSREAPPELALLDGAAHTLELGGLGVDDVQVLLAPKQLEGTAQQWAALNERFGGNGLALKVVGESIRELFGGEIGAYLAVDTTGAGSVFGGIRRVLAEQVDRSSPLEQQVLRLLAVEREPLSIGTVVSELGPAVGSGTVLEAVESLRRRSLVERTETPDAAGFTLQSVMLEFVTNRMVETVVDEIAGGLPVLLVAQPLVKARAKDYVRQTQERLIGAPILQRLNARYDQTGTAQRLLTLLARWRGRPAVAQGYGPGNVVNLLRILRGDLRGRDLSRLAIRQASLAEVEAQDASLAGAHLAEAVLADAFSLPVSVALTGDGGLLAAGTSTGQVWLWRTADRALLATLEGHTGAAWGVALSADGHLLTSSGEDGTVRLWETDTGRPVATLRGHTGMVSDVALSADGRLMASGGEDGTVRLWETGTGRLLATLQDNTSVVRGVALSASGHLVASGREDGAVRLWETSTGRLVATLQDHAGAVWAVALSADGHLVASGSADATVRLWETSTGRPVATFQGHAGGVRGVALSADGHLVASGGADGTVRLWEVGNGQLLTTLQGHTGAVRGIALASDGHLLASGSVDGTVRLWQTGTGRPLASLQGHTGGVWSVALAAEGRRLASGAADGLLRLWDTTTTQLLATLAGHSGAVLSLALLADGRLLASGGKDGTVRLWDVPGGRSLATLQGHTGAVWGVALGAGGQLVASGGEDGMVRVWAAKSGQPLATLQGHAGLVWSVAVAAEGRLLASGGGDGTVRLWALPSGRSLATLRGHSGAVWSVALSQAGQLVASGGADGTVVLWETSTERPLATLPGHTGGVFSVALSREGQRLASGGGDGAVRLWDTSTGHVLATWRHHTSLVRGVALSADGDWLASGGWDGMVRLWETHDGGCVRTLRAERRYERLDITGLTGVTPAQRAALLALGAIERAAARTSA